MDCSSYRERPIQGAWVTRIPTGTVGQGYLCIHTWQLEGRRTQLCALCKQQLLSTAVNAAGATSPQWHASPSVLLVRVTVSRLAVSRDPRCRRCRMCACSHRRSAEESEPECATGGCAPCSSLGHASQSQIKTNMYFLIHVHASSPQRDVRVTGAIFSGGAALLSTR